MRTKWKRAFIMAGCVALGSQVSVAVLADGFIIALAVVVLGVLMYDYNMLNPIYAGCLVALISPSFRGTVLVLQSNMEHFEDRIMWAFSWIYPEIGFYVTYGLCFFLFYKVVRNARNVRNYFFCIVICDFCSNMTELFLRYGGHLASDRDMAGIAMVALARSAIICGLLLSLEFYRSLLSKEEHEERYKKLMIMVSVFKSEIYFMQKNMVEIEDIMKKAFQLYRTMGEKEYPDSMRELSLDIAKDVHEIKKDYIRVIKGLQENFLADMDVHNMCIKDIINILEMDIKEMIFEKKANIHFVAEVKTNFSVEDHFSLMSIIRNLAINSLDAVERMDREGMIKVLVKKNNEEHCYEIDVEDNGGGIRKNDMDDIFDAGYSTKFDDETGNISRGVGLTLVRDLVRDKFCGNIIVKSEEGSGTKFKVLIPENSVEREGL